MTSAAPLLRVDEPDRRLLIADPDLIDGHASALRSAFRIRTVADADDAHGALNDFSPDLVITEMALNGGSGVDICRSAKALSDPPAVLVTTRDPQHAPDAILSGCDSVLLKPFAPNLLYARIGRLIRLRAQQMRGRSMAIRARSAELMERAETQRSKFEHLIDRRGRPEGRSIVEWPNTHCPYCARDGAVSFDYASLRRAWYACLGCRKVWMAKRQE